MSNKMKVVCKKTQCRLINNLKKVSFRKTSNKIANSKMTIKKEVGLIIKEEIEKVKKIIFSRMKVTLM